VRKLLYQKEKFFGQLGVEPTVGVAQHGATMKALKMKPETGRVEKRFAIAVPVRIKSLDRPWLAEAAMTENVSLFGARILVKDIWGKDERVVVESPGGADSCQSRVVYCQALKTGGTAIGVHLAGARPNWMSRRGQRG